MWYIAKKLFNKKFLDWLNCIIWVLLHKKVYLFMHFLTYTEPNYYLRSGVFCFKGWKSKEEQIVRKGFD